MDQEQLDEQREDQYVDAKFALYDQIKGMPAEHVRNLLEIMLVGIFDVGLYESLTWEQAQGVMIFLEDLKQAADASNPLNLDLSKRAEPGAYY